MNLSFVGLADVGWSTEPDVGSLQLGDHDPKVRGFSIPNGELALDGTVDSHFKGFANIVYKLDDKGETGVELEEMYFLTTSLPGEPAAQGRPILCGVRPPERPAPPRLGVCRPAARPQSHVRPRGTAQPGMRVSWLAPTPWYAEAMVGVFNSAGGTAYSFRSDESEEIHGGEPIERAVRSVGDLLIVPRLATSFDVTATQTLVMGVSGAFGPNNSGPDAGTQVYGADLYWKWKSLKAHQGFPFVSFQAEALTRRYDAAAAPVGRRSHRHAARGDAA